MLPDVETIFKVLAKKQEGDEDKLRDKVEYVYESVVYNVMEEEVKKLSKQVKFYVEAFGHLGVYWGILISDINLNFTNKSKVIQDVIKEFMTAYKQEIRDLMKRVKERDVSPYYAEGKLKEWLNEYTYGSSDVYVDDEIFMNFLMKRIKKGQLLFHREDLENFIKKAEERITYWSKVERWVEVFAQELRRGAAKVKK